MTERRRPSALARLREQTRMRVLRPPEELRVDSTLPSATGNMAFCPLLHRATKATRAELPIGRYNRGGMCGVVECGTCALLATELDERQPDYAWLCSKCARGFRAEPYWKDGACDACGFESSVLILAIPPEEEPSSTR